MLTKLPRRLSSTKSTIFPSARRFFSTDSLKFKPPTVAAASTRNGGSNPQLRFPCLDKLEKKNRDLSLGVLKSKVSSLDSGPEPAYNFEQTGFKLYQSQKPIFLDNGGYLPEYEIAYETWGELNESRSNLILVQTGLSASSHAKSHPENKKKGWWENFIGPGKYIDTDKYFVVCTNVLGGCYGSTGPSSIDPSNQEQYATRFPILSVNDMVRAQRELIWDEFHVRKIHAAVGASMGGMQSLAYGWEFPEEVEKIISISACARSHPYSIALRHTQRQVLMSDPNWNRGFYYDGIPPHVGMKLAREIATVTYRSGPEWEYRFGRKRADESRPPALCPDFLVETYLDHAGEKFCLEYDANSWLYISKAMDLFDLGHESRSSALSTRERAEQAYIDRHVTGFESSSNFVPRVPYTEKVSRADVSPDEAISDLALGLKRMADKDVLVIGVESDILFPVWQQREVADVLIKNSEGGEVEYVELGNDISNFGHDTFLLSLDDIGKPVRKFLDN
ncbi:cys2 [[Candida] subhashii]|uniref:Cys2 n=1 Tax=[Candida] subhashii TaxID=561895 RepID=A0A8J5QM01_9ASCO|nr:cys2 [[Candida] subhashii]KAG7663026.1 cys2 [[Candida] subhashii]